MTVRGSVAETKDAFLVAEKVVICQVPIPSIPIVLLGSFYILNMEYTPGLVNVNAVHGDIFFRYAGTKEAEDKSLARRTEQCITLLCVHM